MGGGSRARRHTSRCARDADRAEHASDRKGLPTISAVVRSRFEVSITRPLSPTTIIYLLRPQSLFSPSFPADKVRTISPKEITVTRPGVYVIDFGENSECHHSEYNVALPSSHPARPICLLLLAQSMARQRVELVAGWTTLTIDPNFARGSNITIIHAELLSTNGHCWLCIAPYAKNVSRVQDCPCRREAQMAYASSPMVDHYIMKGDGSPELFEPIGTYHAFRYVEIHGYPAVLSLDSIVAHTVHTAVAKAGAIVTSSVLINQLQVAAVRTIVSNQMGMPTDCPQRERRGWAGDAQISSDTAAWNLVRVQRSCRDQPILKLNKIAGKSFALSAFRSVSRC